MKYLGFYALQDNYNAGGVTWTRNTLRAPGTPPAAQYDRTGGGGHLSIHSAGAYGVISNVHYTNENYNNAKIHYNLDTQTFTVDWAQVGQAGKVGFSASMATMQAELIAFLVTTQIDTLAMNRVNATTQVYQTAEQYHVQAQQQWNPGITFTYGKIRGKGRK